MNEPREGAPFPLKAVAQICIIVPDIDEAVRNWWQIFGVGPWHIYTYGRPLVKHMTRHGEPTDYRMKVALSCIGDMRVELIEPLEGDTVYAEFVEAHGYGIHHLGVLTDDMAGSLEKAREAGFEMTMDGAGFGPDGDGHYAYLDTEKVIHTTLELIERPQGRQPPERIYPPELTSPE